MTTNGSGYPVVDSGIGRWPPDDTEESGLGTHLHETTIINLRLGITGAAHLYKKRDQVPPWRAFHHVLLLGCRRPDGTPYRTYPDLYVYDQRYEEGRPFAVIGAIGPPLLIVEVPSEASYDVDTDIAAGKGYSYANAGVREYLNSVTYSANPTLRPSEL
jgi:hypothetical protein